VHNDALAWDQISARVDRLTVIIHAVSRPSGPHAQWSLQAGMCACSHRTPIRESRQRRTSADPLAATHRASSPHPRKHERSSKAKSHPHKRHARAFAHTHLSTCAWCSPRARRSPISRVRCPTIYEQRHKFHTGSSSATPRIATNSIMKPLGPHRMACRRTVVIVCD